MCGPKKWQDNRVTENIFYSEINISRHSIILPKIDDLIKPPHIAIREKSKTIYSNCQQTTTGQQNTQHQQLGPGDEARIADCTASFASGIR